MPLYPYRCTQCGHGFEKIQSFAAKPETICPKCGGPLERPLTAPGLQFKGAGWYVNDYAPKSSGSTTESPKESAPAAKPSGGESATPTTPAPTSPTTSTAPSASQTTKN